MTKVGLPALGGSNGALAARPAHLTTGDKAQQGSIALLREYVVPPRLKVMQKTRRSPLDQLFQTGDLVAMPMKQLVAGADQNGDGAPIPIVPIFFYPEYISTNPIELGNLPMIRDRSLDQRSPLALLARNQETRQQPHPDNPRYFIRNTEVLTFIVCVSDSASPIYNIPISLSFSRGDYKYGQSFASLIRMRNVDQCYGCQFEAAVGPRKNERGDWKGVNVSNPSTIEGLSPWIEDTALFEFYREMYDKFAADYAASVLRTEVDEDVAGVDAEATAAGRF